MGQSIGSTLLQGLRPYIPNAESRSVVNPTSHITNNFSLIFPLRMPRGNMCPVAGQDRFCKANLWWSPTSLVKLAF